MIEDIESKQGTPVGNAGLVILNIYFKILLERLNLTEGNQFISQEAQHSAVHYLQYIVTGMTQTEEHHLVLNKILCGLEPLEPVEESIVMTEDEKHLIEGMIESAIGHWSSIGQSSINGFRGNWLVREGILREIDEQWELIVEKRSYDLLMHKSPFSFSIIKMPWMQKPLHVHWPY